MLKGSVRWVAGRIHLNTQLIDTRTENKVWAGEYDQDLANVLLTQSDIAQKVADQLEAKVSAVEKVAIKEPDLGSCGLRFLPASERPSFDAI